MPRSTPDGPARHSALKQHLSDFFTHPQPAAPLSDSSIVQHLETKTDSDPKATEAKKPKARLDRADFADQDWTLRPIEESFRHGHWRARRARIIAAMSDASCSPRRIANCLNCGANHLVMQNAVTGELKSCMVKCHDRLCLPCQQERARILQAALHKRVPMAKCLFVVLTLTSSDRPLGEQMTDLYQSSSRLRSSKWWKQNVSGGFQCFECTYNKDTDQWHPHLHLLVHSNWLDQEELSRKWTKASKGSSIVHVSLVRQTTSGILECTKYLAQPVHRSIQFEPSRLSELITALHGRRLCTTFGSWRSDPLLDDRDTTDDANWAIIGTLCGIATQAAQGCAWSKHALLYLQSRRPGRSAVTPPPAFDSS